MVVSCSCSQDVRKGELANLFVNLLCDLSRWVSHQFTASLSRKENWFFQFFNVMNLQGNVVGPYFLNEMLKCQRPVKAKPVCQNFLSL